MIRYRAIRPAVEAMRLQSVRDYLKIVAWMKECGDTCALADEVQYMYPIMLLPVGTGMAVANLGDFIVRDADNHFYPVSPDPFTSMYEAEED